MREDFTGRRYGQNYVISYAGLNEKGTHGMWYCLCFCGNVKKILGYALKRGLSNSCGCLNKKANRDRLMKHGYARTTTYTIWAKMIQRCKNKKNVSYKDYGARGISVCLRWEKSFQNFLNDMGERPSMEYTLERIDNDGNYEPSNCKWGTRTEQMINQRINRKNKTGVRGVSYNESSGTYCAYLCIEGVRHQKHHLKSIDEAINARREMERKFWGKTS